jgi:hexosaminidase
MIMSFVDYLFPKPKELNILSSNPASFNSKVEKLYDSSLSDESYRLIIRENEIKSFASSQAGHFYAEKTVSQLNKINKLHPVYEVEIIDFPDYKQRGVMLDVSRDKVHKMQYLKNLLVLLSEFKLNHVELYFEHSFAYKNHKEVWKDATPFNAEELQDLKTFAKTLHINLVANQNTLGHMERWLIHEAYRPLAFKPEGFRDNLGMLRPPSTLNPTSQEAFKLVSELLNELDEVINSNQFNVGLDEPWELFGKDPSLWLNWLKELSDLKLMRSKEILIWGDYLASYPNLTPSIPENVQVIEWGYESNHPWQSRLEKFKLHKINFWSAPGTSAWLSILGRFENMAKNIQSCVSQSSGAQGILTTDWGDFGHLQPSCIAECGLFFGAAAAWNIHWALSLTPNEVASLCDFHVWGSQDAIYSIVKGLSSFNDCFPLKVPNMAGIIANLYFPQLPTGTGLTTGVNTNNLNDALEIINSYNKEIDAFFDKDKKKELKWATDLVSHLLKDHLTRLKYDGRIESVPEKERQALLKELNLLIESYPEIYTLYFRQGGFKESVRWLTNLRDVYETGQTNINWAGPLTETFYQHHPIPS